MHPLGQRLPGAATGSNAERIEASTDVEVAQLRCLAKDEVAVGSEALRTVDQGANASVGQLRNAAHRELHDRRKVIEVAVEQLKLERARNAVDRPRNRVWLVATHHQAADFLLVVGQSVRVAQRRQVARNLRCELLGDHVLVLHRHERHVHADRCAKRACPLPAADHDLLTLDAAMTAVR